MTPESRKKNRYKHAEGKRWIEVRVRSAQQLFDARDPSPFRERDLDDDFVEYIVSAVSEFSMSTPLKLVIYIDEPEPKDLHKDSIREAIRSFCAYRIDLQRSELRAFLKRAQFFLVIGLVILAGCLGLAQNIELDDPPGVMGILREGIVIFGWVSIWKPIELVLFDWYPLYEKLRLNRKLLGMEIDIRFAAS